MSIAENREINQDICFRFPYYIRNAAKDIIVLTAYI